MNTAKLKEVIDELEAEASRCLKLAGELKDIIKRSNGSAVGHPVLVPPRQPSGTPKSALLTAVDVLAEHGKAVHIKDLVEMVSKRRGFPTPRASIESVLVRAIKDEKFGLKRTAPGTFAVEK